MSSFKFTIIACFFALLFLSACSSSPSHVVMPGEELTPMSEEEKQASMDRLKNAPGYSEVPEFPEPTDSDLSMMTYGMFGDNIKVYNINDDVPKDERISPSISTYRVGEDSIIEPEAEDQTFNSYVSPSDPAVSIFPLDGDVEKAKRRYESQASYEESTYDDEKQWPDALRPVSSGGEYEIDERGYDFPYSGGSEQDEIEGRVDEVPSASIYFEHGSAKISPVYNEVLDAVAEQARYAPIRRVRVEGYASSRVEAISTVRGKMLNLKESMNRAFEVSKQLMLRGVPAEKISTVAWGDTVKNFKNGRRTTEAEARRVDIYAGYPKTKKED